MALKRKRPTKTYSAVVAGNPLTFSVKRGLAKNYLKLVVRPKTGLIVIVPPAFSISRIPDLLKEKIEWILERLKAAEQKLAHKSAAIKDGDEIPYAGRRLKVAIHHKSDADEGAVIKGKNLEIRVRSNGGDINAIIEKWYIAEANRLFTEMTESFSSEMGLEYKRITIKANKSRWGSCSPKKNLNFNWRLIMSPQQVMNYVIIHELAHLKEMNHSKNFWALVSKYCPDWKQHRKWLKDHGKELFEIL